MGQGSSTAPDEQATQAGVEVWSAESQSQPSGQLSPRGRLIKEFRDMLKHLEARLANPTDLNMVGKAYSNILHWAKEHDLELLDWTCRYPANPAVCEVFEALEADHRYAAWFRQALDEAYMLLYEDIAKQGDRKALQALPEPHIPQETGYRTLPSPLAPPSMQNRYNRNALPQPVKQTHEHATGSCYCQSKTCEYEIRTGPPVVYDSSRDKTVCGREIVATGMTERQCILDPVSALFSAIIPRGCCGRTGSSAWSLLGYDGYGPGQPLPRSIPEDAPMWPEPASEQEQVYAPSDVAPKMAQTRQSPSHGASLSNLPRAYRDELLQPSAGKEWWA
jgi:hypothetical protein